jgi:hypothetical protein
VTVILREARMTKRVARFPWKPLLWTAIAAAAVIAFLQWRAAWLKENRARYETDNAFVLAQRSARRRGQPPPPPDARIHESPRYRLITTADAAQTALVADAIEALHDAYVEFFREQLPATAARHPTKKLKVTLYRDRAQFQAYNVSMPWAEAYYLTPMSHAYYVAGAPNPYHWMVHEATHQLNTEVARFKKAPWTDEGLGTYFGTSRFVNGELRPGEIDPDTYPIWWLASFPISGDLDADMRSGRWIPLRVFLTGEGAPPMAGRVNQYYVQYWSLTHFLFHHDNGRYADAYKRLIAEGGTLENFERRIGPVEPVQRAWYRYLLTLRDRYAAAEAARRAN